MAVSMGYDQSVRQLLNNKGVDNSQIGYNPASKSVTVGGQDFMKPPKVYSGTSYTNQQGFDSAWNTYKNPKPAAAAYGASGVPQIADSISGFMNKQPAPTQQAQPAYTPQPTYSPPVQKTNPADDQFNRILAGLMQQVQNPTPVDVNAIYGSPQYAAFQSQAQKGADASIRAAQESMGASGFGRSTALGERSQGIQNDANEYLNTQVLPQLIAQEQASRQQGLQNNFSLLDSLFGQQQLGDTRDQNAESNALERGQLTGSYISPEMRSLYDAVLQDKQEYAAATTPEERQRIRSEADAARSRIFALGGDPSLVGSDVTLDQANGNAPRFGAQTLGAREQDRADANQTFNQDLDLRNQDLNETQVMAALTGFLPDGTPTTDQQQLQLTNLWTQADQTGVIPDQLAELYGVPKGTPTQSAKQWAMTFNRGVKESDRDFNRGVKESDRNYTLDKDKFNADQENTTDTKQRSASPNEVGTLLENLQLQGQDSEGVGYGYIPGKGKPARAAWVQQAVQTLVDANYDNATISQVLRKAGISPEEEDEIFGSGE